MPGGIEIIPVLEIVAPGMGTEPIKDILTKLVIAAPHAVSLVKTLVEFPPEQVLNV